jgi:hypothetical protein
MNFYFFGPESWLESASSHVLVKSLLLWLDFDHKLCDEFLDGTYSNHPKLTSLPFSSGHKRQPAKGLSYCYYLPFQIAYVPLLQEWIQESSASFCAVPFALSQRSRREIYEVCPEADMWCRELLCWSADHQAWKYTDYALIVPRTVVTLAGSETVTGRRRGADPSEPPPFHLGDLMGLPSVNRRLLESGAAYMSSEADTYQPGNGICNRFMIYPREVVISMCSHFTKRQLSSLDMYPVDVF